jgi:hypothetical protein
MAPAAPITIPAITRVKRVIVGLLTAGGIVVTASMIDAPAKFALRRV